MILFYNIKKIPYLCNVFKDLVIDVIDTIDAINIWILGNL